MKKLLLVLTTLLLISCQNTPSFSKKSNTHIAQARQYSADSLRKKAHNLQLTPNWLQENDKNFWFERYSLAHGQEFVLVSTTNFEKIKRHLWL